MNIFFLDRDPEVSATYYFDKHVNKIILEIAQMASTAKQINDGCLFSECYKITHKNHPMSAWVRHSLSNYVLAIRHGLALVEEKKFRFGGDHKSEKVLVWLKDNPPVFFHHELTNPPLCMPDMYKTLDYVESYRNYYKEDKLKKITNKWTKRQPPTWIIT